MVAKLEYLGEDGWEHGFDVCAGDSSALIDVNTQGQEELLYIVCDENNEQTLIYRLVEGEYAWVSPTAFNVNEDKRPTATLRCGSQPFESTLFEGESVHRRNIQITHQPTH